MTATNSPRAFNPADASTEPPAHIMAVTPGTTEFAKLTRAIWVGVAGDVEVEALNESDEFAAIVLPNVAAGMWHPCVCRKILATNTTATSIRRGW